jgi:hypothetical protein
MDDTTGLAARPPSSRAHPTPRVGDVRLLGDMLVAVTAVHLSHLWVHQCHRNPTMAYDFDLIVDLAVDRGGGHDAVDAGPIVVCGELYGPVLAGQLGELVATIPPADARAVAAALRTDAASLAGLEHGTPLAGMDDPRRAYVADLLDSHTAMCAPARDALN